MIQAALPVGTRIGNYEIVDVLGQGGGAITYSCTDTLLGRVVALKEHFPQGLCRRAADGRVEALPGMEEVFEQSVDVFLREARIVAGLKHAHMVLLHDVLSGRGSAYVVLAPEEGELLDAWLTAHAEEPQRLQRVLETLLDVLAFLHARRVYLRDITPADIRVREGDEPVLSVFGAVADGSVSEGALDPQRDLEALGSVYLNGLGAETVAALPRRLRRSLYRATSRRPSRRYRSAAEWQRALRPAPLVGWAASALLLAAAVGGLLWRSAAAPGKTPESAPPVGRTVSAPSASGFSPASVPRTLKGFTLHLLTQDAVCYRSRPKFQPPGAMKEADLIHALKEAFETPLRQPFKAHISPDRFTLGKTTWKVGNAESDYEYKRLENSEYSLLTVVGVEKTQRTPYLLRFSSPTEGHLALPAEGGREIWSYIPFRLEADESTAKVRPALVSAPESLAGLYLFIDRSNMKRYETERTSPATPDGDGVRNKEVVLSGGGTTGLLFRNAHEWESIGELGTYTYERLSDETARITISPADDPLIAISFYLEFADNMSGSLYEHHMGETEAFCDIAFFLEALPVPPRGEFMLKPSPFNEQGKTFTLSTQEHEAP